MNLRKEIFNLHKNSKKSMDYLSPDLYMFSKLYGDDENDIININIGVDYYKNENTH